MINICVKLVFGKIPGLKNLEIVLERRQRMGTVTLIAFGAVIGSIFTGIVFRFFLVGTLRVDRSDPDGPFMFLELKKSIEHVTS